MQCKEEKLLIPNRKKINRYLGGMNHIHYIGRLKEAHCYTAELEDPWDLEEEMLAEGLAFNSLRTLASNVTEDIFNLAGRAIQIINWDKDHKYCGRCGSLMKEGKAERVKLCPQCGLENYPRISPAVIVAILKGDEILLAHNKKFSKGVFSLIAGFVELGESFEECVEREVMEEVGIKVKNIKYFKSQPWPFPNSLMVAFTADYDSGEICPDGVEIEEAHWYKADNLPLIPAKGSIARKLIDWFQSNRQLSIKENK